MNSNKENKKGKSKKINYAFYDFVRVTGVLPIMLAFRPKVYYLGDKKEVKSLKGMLVMANHTGMTDPIAICCALPMRRIFFLATSDLFCSDAKRWFFKKIHCIEIDKRNMNISSYKDVIKYLKEEKAVGVFPEGAINHGDTHEFLQFKNGITFMSIMNKTPILPVYRLKRTKWWHRTKVVIGQPIRLYEECSKIPTIQEIENAGKILLEKEKELRDYYDNIINGGKGK